MISKRISSLWGNQNFPLMLPLCVFLLPLVYRIYPSSFAYTGVICLTFLFLGFLLLTYVISNRFKTVFTFNYIDISVISYLLYCLLNSLLKNSQHAESNENLLLSVTMVLYPALKISIQKSCSLTFLTYIILITGLVIQAAAVLQLFQLLAILNPTYKATSLFFNPNIFCAYLTIQFPVVVYILSKKRARYIIISCLINCAGTLFFDFYLSSRTALLALFIAIVFILINSEILKRYKQTAIATSLIFLVGIIIWSANIKAGSAEGRALIWKISAGMLKDYPLSGSGLGTYKSRYNLYQAAYFKTPGYSQKEALLADENYEPYNDFLGIGIEEGTIGLLLFCAMIGTALFVKTTNEFQIYIKIALVIFSIISVFSYPFEEPSLFITFFAFVAFVSSFTESRVITISYFFTFIMVALGLCCLSRFYYYNRWLNLKIQGQYNLQFYTENYIYLKNDANFLLEYANELSKVNNYNQAIPMAFKSKGLIPSVLVFEQLGTYYYRVNKLDNAQQNFTEATFVAPEKFSSKYLLFNYLKLTNNFNQAKLIAKTILAAKIKIPSPEIEMIKKDAKCFIDTIGQSHDSK